MGPATSREDAAAEDDEEDSGLDLAVPTMVVVSPCTIDIRQFVTGRESQSGTLTKGVMGSRSNIGYGRFAIIII